MVRMTNEPRSRVVARRLRSVTVVIVLFIVLTVLFPIAAPVLAVIDGVRRDRWIMVRLLAFAWIYLFGEMAGTVGAFALWLAYPGHGRRYIEQNYRLQFWWAQFLFDGVRRLLSLTFRVEGDDAIEPAPILVFMRHASIIDNLIPLVFVSKPHDIRLRYVLKRELLSDPALDIVGNRTPNYFVDREGESEGEISAIRRLASGLEPGEGVIIYPEGTRFTRQKQSRILAKLEDTPLFERARRLHRVLPPKVGGPLALLDGAPDADVVVCAHRGLEGFATVGDILSGSIVGTEVSVTFWRVPRSEVPESPDERVEWLFAMWEQVDALAGEPAH